MATTYDKASLVMIPSGYKDDKLYSVKPTDGSGDFTFSRDGAGASPATRVNASGLIEKGRENLVLHSQDFSNGAWVKNSLINTSFNETDPNGGSTAFKAESSGNAYIYQDVTTSVGNVYVWSFYAKSDTPTSVDIRVDASTEPISLTTEWQRFSKFFIASSTTTRLWMGAGFTWGAGEVAYIAFAQAEQGLAATDYIATTTAPVSAGLLGDMPRLDYSGGATCPSLLLEPSRVNLVRQSEYFGALWTQDNLSVDTNADTSPEGVVNASKVIPSTSTSLHRLRSNTINISANGAYSIFVKADGYSKVGIREDNAQGRYATFNLSTGVLIEETASGAADIEDYGNGWYRIYFDDNAVSSVCQLSLYILPDSYTSGAPTATTWAGDGIKGVLAYGGMVEEGSYPTSYIPTYGSASTRGDDYQTSTTNYKTQGILGSTWTFLYDQTFVDVAREAASSLFLLDNGIGGDGLTNVRISLNSNGSFRLQDSDGTQLSTSGNKILCRYDGSTIAWFVDGSLLDSHNVTDTDFANLDQYNPSQNNRKKVVFNQLLIFPTSLTDAECIALTA